MGADVSDFTRELYYHLIAFGSLTGLIGLAVWLLRTLKTSGRWLPLPRLRRANLEGSQVLWAFLVMALTPSLTQQFCVASRFFSLLYGRDSSPVREGLWSSLLALPIVIPAIFCFLFFTNRTRPGQLGVSKTRFLPNLILGCLAWFPLTILTLAVHFLVLQWIPGQDHPLTQLANESLFPWEWALIALEALLAAPILEELVFRGILAGWLLRCSKNGHYAVMSASLVLAGWFFFSPPQGSEPNLGPLLFVLVLLPGYGFIVYRWGPTGSGNSADLPPPLRHPWPAIVGSSLLWAVFHAAVWPSPIPLFVLGLGLGWLAYRTQNLVCPLIVHLLFNAVAFLVLAMSALG